MLTAPLQGFGLAYVREDLARPRFGSGSLLLPVLEEWWPYCPGYNLYNGSRRHASPAFAPVVDALALPRITIKPP